LARQRQQAGANGGQLDPVPAPVEQLDVVAALQPLHLGGQGGLAHAQRPRGGAEGPVLGNGKEGAKLGG